VVNPLLNILDAEMLLVSGKIIATAGRIRTNKRFPTNHLSPD